MNSILKQCRFYSFLLGEKITKPKYFTDESRKHNNQPGFRYPCVGIHTCLHTWSTDLASKSFGCPQDQYVHPPIQTWYQSIPMLTIWDAYSVNFCHFDYGTSSYCTATDTPVWNSIQKTAHSCAKPCLIKSTSAHQAVAAIRCCWRPSGPLLLYHSSYRNTVVYEYDTPISSHGSCSL